VAAGAGSGGAMVKIDEKIVPAGGQAAIDFTAIPQTYKHLKAILNGRIDTAGAGAVDIFMQLNGDIGANYDYWGSASAYATTSLKLGSVSAGAAPAWASGTAEIDLRDYRNTTFGKTMTSDNGRQDTAGAAFTASQYGAWHTTGAAITSLHIFGGSGNFVAGSTVSLYGIA